MNIGENIKCLRKAKNCTQAEFAKKLGIKPNTVTSYETGLRVPSDTVIISICREFNVSEVWLRTGEGTMTLPISEDEELDAILGEISGSDDTVIKSIIKAYWNLEEKEKAVMKKFIDSFLGNVQ